MMSGCRALLLDFDGTLADSLGVMKDVYRAFLTGHGATPSDAEFDRLNGPPLAEVVADLCQTHHIALAPDDALRRYGAEIDRALDQVRPSHGAGAVLAAAHDLGWNVGIVTSNDRARVQAWLARTNLASLVDVVIGGEVHPGKPDPLPYLTALERLGCAAEHVFAVEDSVQGYQAAAAAGIRTFFYRPLDRPDAVAGAETLESLSALLPLLRGSPRGLAMRLATMDDKPFLFSLRNDPAAAANSRTPRSLSPAELEERFACDPTLRDKLTFVAVRGETRLAMVRFDRGEDGYTISIIVEPSARARGIGQESLMAAINAFQSMRGPVPLHAEVATDNPGSAKMFSRCGFTLAGTVGRFDQFILSP